MADVDVIAGAGEQTTVEAPHVEAAPVEPEGSAGALVVDDGSGSDGAATPAAETAPESLDALWERFPSLREQYEAKVAERENAGAQRREAQLKREAGKKGQTKANVQRFLSQVGMDVDDTGQLDYFYDLAAANAAYELATTLPETVLRNYQVPPEARERAVEAREAGDWDGYLTTLVEAAAEHKVTQLRAEDEQKVAAEVQKRLAAEIKARGLEKAPVTAGAPTRPGGGSSAGGITPAELEAMPTSVFMSKTPEERQRLVNEARSNARAAGVAR